MADYKWADLTEWIACLCAADSPNLAAALWLVSTCTTPEKHLQFQGEDRYLESWIAIEGIIDDACMALPGKVFRICQLLSSQPVCH